MPKHILITGSNAGIGKKTAWLFAQKGWKVAATMRNPQKAAELADHPNIHIYPLDVTDSQSIQAAAEACLADFQQLDVVVNNAGFGVYGPMELASEAEIDRQFDVNLKGVIRVMKAFLPHFRTRKAGLFINISSIAGLITYPLGSLYNASKWALEGLTEAISFELKPLNIRVKLVEPGSFGTSFQQVGLVWTQKDGIQDYDPMIQHIQKRRTDLQESLPDSILVAEKIYEAATDSSPRLRYLVGKDAEALYQRRLQVDPDAFMEELYRKMMDS